MRKPALCKLLHPFFLSADSIRVLPEEEIRAASGILLRDWCATAALFDACRKFGGGRRAHACYNVGRGQGSDRSCCFVGLAAMGAGETLFLRIPIWDLGGPLGPKLKEFGPGTLTGLFAAFF